MTARSTWKAFERDVAQRLGGRRIPVTGIDRHGADVVTPMFDVQVKLRNTVPDYLLEWLDGIRATARASNKIGIVVWRRPRARSDDALVILRLKDWEDLHGRLPDDQQGLLSPNADTD